MQRVMIVGGPGSGKSTLARLLGDRTGLPVFHMDHIHWKSGWVERPADEKTRMAEEVHRRESWIFEGGHSRTYAARVARADTMIWLDIPVGLRLWRVIRRMLVTYGQSRPDLPDGCPERFSRETFEFVAFIWRTRRTARAKLKAIADNPPPNLTVHHLGSLGDVRHFLDTVDGGQ